MAVGEPEVWHWNETMEDFAERIEPCASLGCDIWSVVDEERKGCWLVHGNLESEARRFYPYVKRSDDDLGDITVFIPDLNAWLASVHEYEGRA